MKTIGHLENIGQSYYAHFTHGFLAGPALMLFAFSCFVDAFFPIFYKHFEYVRRKTVNAFYTGITNRWYMFSLHNLSIESRKEFASQLSELKLIEKTRKKNKVPVSGDDIEFTNSYFKHLQFQLHKSLEYTKCAISSTIHITFPDILVDDAPKRLIKIYLEMYYSK
jgi:hypothetical protein